MKNMKKKVLRILGLALVTVSCTLFGFAVISVAIQLGLFRFVAQIVLACIFSALLFAAYFGGLHLMANNKK